MHVLEREATGPIRFGFIVSKVVGGAVVRNRVKRRMRAIGHELLPQLRGGCDIVIRALPESGQSPWATLHSEIADGLRRGGAA